ncbi:MAG TPA: hypothetical protein VJN95_13655 [Gemmatimonadales bacterium]|nr:hypothetical protein [Gemmatimonadales bacterium]
MRATRLIFALAALAASAAPLAAQSKADDRWQLTLENGNYIWDVRLVRLDGQNLVYRQADSTAQVSVGDITEVRRIRKSEVRLADGAGGAMPALTGADDEIYDFRTLDFDGRLKAVQSILLTNASPDKP